MAEIVTFRLRGMAELDAALKRVGYAIARKIADKALKKAIDPIVEEAKRLVPVKTGALQKSISSNPDPDHGPEERAVLMGVVPPVSRRAHFTEFGTIRSAAHPFIRPAFDAEAQRSLVILGEEVGARLEQEAESGYRKP